MTNAVDVLMIDGPHHGEVVCMKKPLVRYIEYPELPTVPYERRVFIGTGNKRYHIAQHPDGASNPSDIEFTIIARNFPPSWDLN
jgi:hypothetical protein